MLLCSLHIAQQNSWKSVAAIIKYYGDAQDAFQPYAGPGHWNDPDMVGCLFAYGQVWLQVKPLPVTLNVSVK